jgi:hypothetical protein
MKKANNKVGWAKLRDEKLLDVRICDLGVTIDGSEVEDWVDELGANLADRGMAWRPHVWLSNEWFSSDGIPGFAIPFYLAHPRLKELERAQMLEVEGGTHDWGMRLMRHECGHAIDNAYWMNRKRRYRQLFGNYGDPYPDTYRPKPYSRQFVVHLDMWYAQAHPAEDFAETFAVWLNPNSYWQSTYEGWGAMRKLKWVNEVMGKLAQEVAPVRNHRVKRGLHTLRGTLREYYAKKRAYYYRDHPQFYDRDLRRIFSDAPEYSRNMDAGTFVERMSGETRHLVSRWTGESQLTIDRALADMIRRVRELKLRLRKGMDETKVDVTMMLAVQTMNWLNDGKHRVVV